MEGVRTAQAGIKAFYNVCMHRGTRLVGAQDPLGGKEITCSFHNWSYNLDGSLKNGACTATYSNEVVRSYAYAMTGWTYPAGGATSYGCWPSCVVSAPRISNDRLQRISTAPFDAAHFPQTGFLPQKGLWHEIPQARQ